MYNVCDLEQWVACICDAGQHVLGGLQAQGLGGQVETWERVNYVATEMGDRKFRARGVVGGAGQYTGGGIQNSLIGKAVVALNVKGERCLCLRKVRTQHVITRDERRDNCSFKFFLQVKHKRGGALSLSLARSLFRCPCPDLPLPLWFPDREFPSCMWLTTG